MTSPLAKPVLGILGAGFGLYGYLPAAVQIGTSTVLMPKRYAERLRGRPELAYLSDTVCWEEDDAAVIAGSDALVFARRPEDQDQALPALLAAPRLQRILLEKPLAPTPARAATMLSALRDSGRTVRIGYTFNDLAWAEAARTALSSGSPPARISIGWHFRAHHFATNKIDAWKRDPGRGGGALRFYGIQLIGLLAELGYSACTASSTGDAARWWRARFAAPERPECEVDVHSDAAATVFTVSLGEATPIVLSDPFAGLVAPGGLDRRVGVLNGLLSSLLSVGSQDMSWYEPSIRLWAAAEAASGLPTEASS